MKVTFFAWETAKRQIQQLLGSVPWESKTEVVSHAVAGAAFRVTHNLPVGIKPNSVWGTVMGAGYLYYNAGDKVLWTANVQGGTSTQTPQQGIVVVRCSLAKTRCEVHVAAYDE